MLSGIFKVTEGNFQDQNPIFGFPSKKTTTTWDMTIVESTSYSNEVKEQFSFAPSSFNSAAAKFIKFRWNFSFIDCSEVHFDPNHVCTWKAFLTICMECSTGCISETFGFGSVSSLNQRSSSTLTCEVIVYQNIVVNNNGTICYSMIHRTLWVVIFIGESKCCCFTAS